MNVHTSKTLLRNYVSTLNEVKKKDKNQFNFKLYSMNILKLILPIIWFVSPKKIKIKTFNPSACEAEASR